MAVLLVWPVIMLIVGAFRSAPPGFAGHWTLAAWTEAFSGPSTARAIRNSVIIALVGTAGATLLAAGLAFLSERTDAPLRRWITPGLAIMFATPGVFYALGYALLANTYTGLLNDIVRFVTRSDWAPFNVETWSGVLAVITLKKVAFIYLFLVGPFRALDPAHDEASLISGASRLATFLKINLPILAPALTGAVLIGVVTGLQAYDMILILGWPIDMQVVVMRVMEFVNQGASPRYSHASVLSLVLLAVVGGLTLIQARILSGRSFVTVGGKSRDSHRLELGKARWFFGALIGLYLLAAAILPIGSVLFTSIQPFPGVYRNLSLDNYAYVLSIPRVVDSLKLTLLLAGGIGLAAMVLGVVASRAGQTRGPRTTALLRAMAFTPLTMPGAVTALAIAWAFLPLPGFRHLYGTVELVGLALLVCVIPFAFQAAHAALTQVSPDLQEAAAVSGATDLQIFIDITLKLIAPSFIVGWFMVAILVSGNIEAPLLLKAPGEQPIMTIIYDLNTQGEFPAACALLILTLLAQGFIAAGGYGALRLAAKASTLRHGRQA